MPIDTSGWERKATEISERIQQQNTPFKTILDPHYEAPASTVFQDYAGRVIRQSGLGTTWQLKLSATR